MSFVPDTQIFCETRRAINFGERASHLTIDILLLHYTGMESEDAALDWLCQEESGVSCHYFVFGDGRIVQLVPEEKRAWHAGKSCWQGETDINSRSIGIEIANPGHGYGYPEFQDTQIASVISLGRDIAERHAIPAKNVLAHSDVAPGRKQDPGEKFPWRRLYECGLGHWACAEPCLSDVNLKAGDRGEAVISFQRQLAQYGYDVSVNGEYDRQTHDCVYAFQQHFRQTNVDGIADWHTMETLNALIS